MANPADNNPDASANQEGSEKQIDWEKRFKDTQGSFTRSQQELKASEARVKALEEEVKPQVVLDEATQKELDDLKYSNPDAWRNKMNNLEASANTAHREKMASVSAEASYQAELEGRAQSLQSFQQKNPNINITDDVIKYDIPPRITKELEQGNVTFDQYLENVAKYLTTGKVIGSGETTLGQPDLGKAGGGDTPSESAVKQDAVTDYSNMLL